MVILRPPVLRNPQFSRNIGASPSPSLQEVLRSRVSLPSPSNPSSSRAVAPLPCRSWFANTNGTRNRLHFLCVWVSDSRHMITRIGLCLSFQGLVFPRVCPGSPHLRLLLLRFLLHSLRSSLGSNMPWPYHHHQS